MIFGTNALITKPAQSLFPMIIVSILTTYGYQGAVKEMSSYNRSDFPDLKIAGVIFNLACGVPFIVGIFQLIFWSFYSIRNTHKSEVHDVIPNVV